MNPITKAEFRKASENTPYLKRRWAYSKIVIDFVMESKFESCLEIGPAFLPLFHDSHVLDLRQQCERKVDFLIDCCEVIPWPIENKQYDVVIALQVWEHLGKPGTAFSEVKRIAKNAVISLPYKWTSKSRASSCHWGIDEKTILGWTDLQPTRTELVPSRKNPDKRKIWDNILCFYEML